MLVLTRKVNETIRISDNITVKIIRVKGSQVQIGIDAPVHIRIERQDYAKISNKD